MAIVSRKCTACGANIHVTEGDTSAVCEYCNTPYSVKKPDAEGEKIIYNNYYTVPPDAAARQAPPPRRRENAPPRPQIKVGVAIVGFIFWFWPGAVYIVYKLWKQHEWDKEYGGR